MPNLHFSSYGFVREQLFITGTWFENYSFGRWRWSSVEFVFVMDRSELVVEQSSAEILEWFRVVALTGEGRREKFFQDEKQVAELGICNNLDWQYMPWSRIFGHWAGKLLSVVARLFLGSNICGTPFPQTFTIFWQVSQMWLTWAYWVERKKQSVVFTRNANMTFSGWRQSLFPAHGRGNKKRWIFVISIKPLYSAVSWSSALTEIILQEFLQKKPIFCLCFRAERGGRQWWCPDCHPHVTFCPRAWVWQCLEELFSPGDGFGHSQSILPWEQSVPAWSHPG